MATFAMMLGLDGAFPAHPGQVKALHLALLGDLWIVVECEDRTRLRLPDGSVKVFQSLNVERILRGRTPTFSLSEDFIRVSFLRKVGDLEGLCIYSSDKIVIFMYIGRLTGRRYRYQPIYVEYYLVDNKTLWFLDRPLNGQIWSHEEILRLVETRCRSQVQRVH